MNFEQLCEMERAYINWDKEKYIKPYRWQKVTSLSIYKSAGQKVSTLNFYYIFIADYFMCALRVEENELEFFSENRLKEKFIE